MTQWLRCLLDGEERFGTLEGEMIALHRGDMFTGAQPTGRRIPLASVALLAPVRPRKMFALWNNFHALGAKLGVAAPEHPLYLMKAPTCLEAPDATVHRPAAYNGRTAFEGELAIVMGRRCANASEDEAAQALFGYTCVNDLTASDLLNRDPNFPQWVRAKSFDGFGPLGPVVATGLDPESLSVRTIVNGVERQNYPIADMIFPVPRLVSLLSRDVTLEPGDVICCGTSVGVGALKEPRNTIEVVIDGIGTLRTTYVNERRAAA